MRGGDEGNSFFCRMTHFAQKKLLFKTQRGRIVALLLQLSCFFLSLICNL
jgi:hypothetical protein